MLNYELWRWWPSWIADQHKHCKVKDLTRKIIAKLDFKLFNGLRKKLSIYKYYQHGLFDI